MVVGLAGGFCGLVSVFALLLPLVASLLFACVARLGWLAPLSLSCLVRVPRWLGVAWPLAFRDIWWQLRFSVRILFELLSSQDVSVQ